MDTGGTGYSFSRGGAGRSKPRATDITLNGQSQIVALSNRDGIHYDNPFYQHGSTNTKIKVNKDAHVHGGRYAVHNAFGSFGEDLHITLDLAGTLSTDNAAGSVVANLAEGDDTLVYRPGARVLTEVGIAKDNDGKVIRDSQGRVTFTDKNKAADAEDDFSDNDNGVINAGAGTDTLRLAGDETNGVTAKAAQFNNFERLQSTSGENTWVGSLTSYEVAVLNGRLSLTAGETDASKVTEKLTVQVSGTGTFVIGEGASVVSSTADTAALTFEATGLEATDAARLTDTDTSGAGARLILAKGASISTTADRAHGISAAGHGKVEGDTRIPVHITLEEGATISTRGSETHGIHSTGDYADILLEKDARIFLDSTYAGSYRFVYTHSHGIRSEGADARITLNGARIDLLVGALDTLSSASSAIFTSGARAAILLDRGTSITLNDKISFGIYNTGKEAEIVLRGASIGVRASTDTPSVDPYVDSAQAIRNEGNETNIALVDAHISFENGANNNINGIYNKGDNVNIALTSSSIYLPDGSYGGGEGFDNDGKGVHLTLTDSIVYLGGEDSGTVENDGQDFTLTMNGKSRIVAANTDSDAVDSTDAFHMTVSGDAWIHSSRFRAVKSDGDNSQTLDLAGTLSTGEGEGSVVVDLASGDDTLVYRPGARVLTEVGFNLKEDADGRLIQDDADWVTFTDKNKAADAEDDFSDNDNGVINAGTDTDTLVLAAGLLADIDRNNPATPIDEAARTFNLDGIDNTGRFRHFEIVEIARAAVWRLVGTLNINNLDDPLAFVGPAADHDPGAARLTLAGTLSGSDLLIKGSTGQDELVLDGGTLGGTGTDTMLVDLGSGTDRFDYHKDSTIAGGYLSGGDDTDTLGLGGGVTAKPMQFRDFERLESNGENTWDGDLMDYEVRLAAGQLQVAGDYAAATLWIDTGSRLKITGDYQSTGDSNLHIRASALSGDTPLIEVESAATLAGTLEVVGNLADGRYQLIEATDGVTGDFSGISSIDENGEELAHMALEIVKHGDPETRADIASKDTTPPPPGSCPRSRHTRSR